MRNQYHRSHIRVKNKTTVIAEVDTEIQFSEVSWARKFHSSKGPSQSSFVPFHCRISVMPISSRKVICVSLAHIIFGTLMTVGGVLQVILQLKFLWLDSFYTGIWVGIWVSNIDQYYSTVSTCRNCKIPSLQTHQ